MHIGCHLSVADGYAAMGRTALSLQADTFQFFTRNPRGASAKEIDPADVAELNVILRENHFAPLVAHAPYTLNPCSAEKKTRDLALMLMLSDLERMELIPGNYYNFHPGSHVGQGDDAGLQLLHVFLETILPHAKNTTVLIETMAGKGSEIGYTFEQVAEMIRSAGSPDNLGVCMDTCHIYSAGYDVVNDLDRVLTHFDETIGLNRLKAIHLNDSMTPFSSRKDRHECIGNGSLGLDAVAKVINHPALKDLPFILETPNELEGYRKEIALLRGLSAK
ncbi:MAG: deoxyribonuclease IV [Lentisphaeria bacterium]|nr:deoxyribonuclease IV [Lentisphaeria bacterium]